MIPILTSSQMRECDARAVAERGVDALVRAAGSAVAFEARRMLGRCYGARVAVVVGPGLNGADGRIAASLLKGRGAHVDVIDVSVQPSELRGYDLVIDAAFGLGCSRPYFAPTVSSRSKVLAVDVPSGVNSDTGEILGTPMRADVTIAIGALKHAHVDGDASRIVGELRFAGLDIVGEFDDGLIEDGDLGSLLSSDRDDHKWSHATTAFCGSTLMPGAAELVVRGALVGGSSMVRLSSRGDVATMVRVPPEAVHTNDTVVDPRCRSVVAGPGLGPDAAAWLAQRLSGVEVPVVLDADGLAPEVVDLARRATAPWILTPHAGEFARLTGVPMPSNRIDAVRALARELECVVLLKGPLTILADQSGALRIVNAGTSALATAGTGDVLAGVIAGSIARGRDVLTAGALSAHLHGRAGARLAPYGTSSQLPGAISAVLEGLPSDDR